MPRFISNLLILILFSLVSFSPSSWAEDEEAEIPVAIYYQFPEPITINFLRQSQQQARYLQIKVALMSYEQETIDNAVLNLPMLQDALRTLLSDQSMASISSIAGRAELQTNALTSVKTLLKQESGKDDLEAIYFTSFILQ